MKVLVVDDDKTVLGSLRGILESEGYGVDTAERGQQALEMVKSEFYDLVLLDIKLPDMEGTKLLKTLHDGFPETVKIMVTGFPTLENAVESLNEGADEYLMKPVNPRSLLKVVKRELMEREKAKRDGKRRVKPPKERREKSSSSTEEETKPLDEMIERAVSLLQESRARAPRNSETRKDNTTERKPLSPQHTPQSPEQSFWFSLANLDLRSEGISKKLEKEKTNAYSG